MLIYEYHILKTCTQYMKNMIIKTSLGYTVVMKEYAPPPFILDII